MESKMPSLTGSDSDAAQDARRVATKGGTNLTSPHRQDWSSSSSSSHRIITTLPGLIKSYGQL